MQKVQNQKRKYQNRKRHVMTRYTIVARNFDLINRALYNEVNLLSCLALVIILPTGLINNQYPAARESRRGKMSVARESRRGKKKRTNLLPLFFLFRLARSLRGKDRRGEDQRG